MKKMPVIFVGHGTPMNAIEDNQYTRKWQEIGLNMEKPKAILSISAHWVSENNTYIQKEEHPVQIYDMYGFPKKLYELKYEPIGDLELSNRVEELLNIDINNKWGIDHGTWAVLCHMFPKADIPVIQLSLDYNKSFKEHFELAKKLKVLREEGILIFCSGNVVHNLMLLNPQDSSLSKKGKTFDDYIKDSMLNKDFKNLYNLENNKDLKEEFYYSVPTNEHYLPLLYAAANCDNSDNVVVFNEGGSMGSLSMTSYLIGDL
ncbi:4,5-DOPA dioxygenase extradiol [Peptoniphilus stercorisuis]|uniref:4,5-DOPA dioxygenase extradiol n=1 Tax=Peptoniphilus stercorisuis TaxID=1436965 RepID=A0ABS4KEF9_9FIRM|nr:4,5-DOPA dioxygenase extradiol [Peptoniphilus stercorisuis]MBP2026148.1 4,5-DOPA dioxygenase extradiol [Peptoniphilus stercorisuis]